MGGCPTKFSKGEGLDMTSIFRGGCEKEGVTFFRRGCSFYLKNKLKSVILIMTKVYKCNCFSLS